MVTDFGFHNPYDYVESMTSLLELSGFQAWPQPGGMEDQSSTFIEDVTTFLSLKRAVKEDRVSIPVYQSLDQARTLTQSAKRQRLPFGE